MSKFKRGRRAGVNGRSAENKRHVRLHVWVTQSDAFRDLNPFEARLLLALYELYNGYNNGDLFLSCREAARRCKMSKNTASKSFHRLIELGFIRRRADEPENYSLGEANHWILTEFEYGTRPPTKEFLKWQPKENNPNSRP